MDPKLVGMLADYMEKTGSISAETRDLVARMYRVIERQDGEKTASLSALKDRAGALAQKMANVRLMTGQPLIDGYEMIKQAAGMMAEHEQALVLLDMVLDSMQNDHRKQASLEPGKAVGTPQGGNRSAIDDLMADCGIAP